MKAQTNSAAARISAAGILLVTSFILTGCGPDSYQAHFLASWSPDGSQAAAVPSLFDDKRSDWGVWLLDVAKGRSRQLYQAQEGYACLQPTWSPHDQVLLFGVFRKDDDEKDGRVTIALWQVRSNGTGARKVAETVVNHDDDSILLPNGIGWGPTPGTIYFPERVDDEQTTMILLDLCTGARRALLPFPAARYSFAVSPSGERVAAVLQGRKDDLAELWISEFSWPHWRRLGYVSADTELLDRHIALVGWSPDSASLAIPEREESQVDKKSSRFFIRWISIQTGETGRIETGQINAPLRWKNGGELLCSVDDSKEGSAILDLDLRSGTAATIVSGENIRLVAWNGNTASISFLQSVPEKKHGERESRIFRLYSSSGDGRRLQGIGAPIVSDDLGWAVSPDGAKMILFAEGQRVLMLDSAAGGKRRSRVITLDMSR